ncbi:FAD:protein FMN transferase [uncultured Paracoccus sp.]|uniref:FAD:protein FMN transferase n=1 Tax=uncultured Paracoccus sp. TaxID=189685 RepID=UPI002602A98D|nr:FAD:protein FMN transferase [uncultured Paracoccus sp.]
MRAAVFPSGLPRRLLLTRRDVLSAGLAALAAPALARAAGPVAVLAGAAFGTGWRVTLPAGRHVDVHRGAIEALLASLDAALSPWRPDSAVSRFNAAAAGGRPVPQSTLRVTRAALDIARASAGCFDPTVGPLVARWGFGPIAGDAAARWTGVRVDGGHLVKEDDGLTLDLCGIGKGHALDRMAELLVERGEADFLVDLGGELLARGRHPSGRNWTVAVEDPRADRPDGMAAAVLRLNGEAVATSGTRRQGYDLGGRRISHIIDPRRRAPRQGRLEQVSVVAADAMTADGWATALMAAGATEGPALARRAGINALFVLADEPAPVMTGSFAARLV